MPKLVLYSLVRIASIECTYTHYKVARKAMRDFVTLDAQNTFH